MTLIIQSWDIRICIQISKPDNYGLSVNLKFSFYFLAGLETKIWLQKNRRCGGQMADWVTRSSWFVLWLLLCIMNFYKTLLVFPILQFLFFVYFNPLYFILDSKEDQFEKLNKDKKERIAKNELQRLRNIARNKKSGENFGSCYLLQVMIPLLVYGIQAAYYWKVNKILAVIFILNLFKWMNIVFKYFLLWF